jgi:UDP-GlcNAc:undecaprenyl-phosphate GlcNAc-1-phosphate transferase
MFDIGHTHRGTVLLLWAWAALIAFGVVAIGLLGGPVPMAVVAGTGLLLLLGTLVSPARLRRRRARRADEHAGTRG